MSWTLPLQPVAEPVSALRPSPRKGASQYHSLMCKATSCLMRVLSVCQEAAAAICYVDPALALMTQIPY